jgi:periplasmic protein TonB
MFDVSPRRPRRTGRIASSVALHAAVVAALLRPGQEIRVRESLPGTSLGTRMELTYLPGGESASAANRRRSVASKMPARRLAPEKKVAPQLAPIAPAAASVAAQESSKTSPAPSSGQAGAASNDALGTDDIQIALTTYSPSPAPDLSRLPRGKQGDVIIDITIDPTGKVADLQILQPLGYGVDGKVADIVRTWMFRPATKDGVPVASVQELHFHYGPA